MVVGPLHFTSELGHVVNEGLMAIFFFMVGLEIKREFVDGDLRQWRTASLPVICAAGGVALPALLYLAINRGHVGSPGWGIPMATDIAFAVSVVALLGTRVSPALKLFLLTLAVVDDLVAIVVIGVFYSSGLTYLPLAVALALVAGLVALRLLHVRWWPAFVLPGIAVWFCVYASGASPTIAGVVLALLVPARPRTETEVLRDWQLDLEDDLTPADADLLRKYTATAVSTADRTIHGLHPMVSFVIVPIFALANAGVVFSGDVLQSPDTARVAIGIVVGLVVGKTVGIVVAAALAIRLGVSHLPRDTTWSQFVGVAAICGIGFTVSLFIANVAFPDPVLVNAAKLAILVASCVAAAVGAAILLATGHRSHRSSPATGG